MKLFTAGYTFASLRVRDYRLMWLAQLGTSMGQWMDQMTRGWLMYEITGSALQLGLATALRGLPLLFFGILAGAVADRSNRKSQLIMAQVINALLNVILATLVLLHLVQPWHVYVTGFLAGTVQAFQQPARQTLISDIVGARHLMNALALNSMALNVSRALGPAAAGLLIAFFGAHGSYYTQAAMFILATLWTMQMAMPARSPESAAVRREPFLRSIAAGLDLRGPRSRCAHADDPGPWSSDAGHAVYESDAHLCQGCPTRRRPAAGFFAHHNSIDPKTISGCKFCK